jgi:predicted ATPase
VIRSLSIENFKAFRKSQFDLSALTVLTGMNSTGKSTVIQALLLAQLAAECDDGRVPLNGPYGLALGEAMNVLHASADEQLITLQLIGDSGIEKIHLSVPNDRSLALDMVMPTSPTDRNRQRDGHVDTYLSAERLGPRDLLEIAVSTESRISVGHQGQYTAHALAQSERLVLASGLLHPDTEKDGISVTLEAQAQAWLSSIVRPVQFEARWLPGVGAATIRFRDLTVAGGISAEWSRPANVGFGLSYALPVIVAALMAVPGSLLLIENPEAHLHPAGQSQIGQFLARIAASGVQVVVETHSDHVVNGIRLATASEIGPLTPESVAIHFFGPERTHSTVRIQGSGALSEWPQGFFDQADSDLAELSRLKRRA